MEKFTVEQRATLRAYFRLHSVRTCLLLETDWGYKREKNIHFLFLFVDNFLFWCTSGSYNSSREKLTKVTDCRKCVNRWSKNWSGYKYNTWEDIEIKQHIIKHVRLGPGGAQDMGQEILRETEKKCERIGNSFIILSFTLLFSYSYILYCHRFVFYVSG